MEGVLYREAREEPHPRVGPGDQVRKEEGLDQEGAAGAVEPEEVHHPEQISNDIGGVVQEEDNEADRHVVVEVGQANEAQRRDMVPVHYEVVLMLGLEELVGEGGHEPEPHLHDVEAPQAHGGFTARPSQPCPPRPSVRPHDPAVGLKQAVLVPGHAHVDDKAPALIGELAEVARLLPGRLRRDVPPEVPEAAFACGEED
mmetsp:Transcript_578/g.1595  ORF Transcript_578/g.1595 Transcript_578/m.1595 type:complete len:200 (-) Transcript_578:238-837(-)